MATDILVFIPGTLGSELWEANDKVWPGTLAEGIGGYGQQRFQQLLKPGLEPRDIVRSAASGIIGIYKSWIEAFQAISRGGNTIFREKPSAGLPKTLYVFPYDWRLDLRDTAKRLDAFLEDIVKKTPDVDIHLVCHSMGGVVARYYLESGKYANQAALAQISLLATLGTPHNGAPVAFAGAAGLHKASFLSVAQTQQLANDTRYPSLYQLFPIASQSFIWSWDPKYALQNFAADDATLVNHLGLTASSLDAWRQFRTGLTGQRPKHVRYFFIIGSRQETLVRLRWTPPSNVAASLTIEELDDSGDGTVPLLGAMDTGTQCQFVGKSHVSLIETQPARATLAALFGATTLFGEEAEAKITLAVRDTAVTTADSIRVLIEFAPAVNRFKGDLAFQRDTTPAAAADQDVVPKFVDFPGGPPILVELAGVGFTHVNLKAPAIKITGIYRPVLRQGGGAADIVGPAFAVQPAT
jgi:pimeloyl-ACP methyl ester carboxylesterase